MFRRTRRSCLQCWHLLIFTLLSLPALAQTPVPGNAAPTQPSREASAPAVPSTPQGSTSKLGAGDLIDLNVYGVPDLSTKARIGNSGDVYLPLVDYIHVARLAVDEAQEMIKKSPEERGL